MKTAPFDIPAINNHLEALAIFLNIDSNDDNAMKAIEQRYTARAVHIYYHENIAYYVACSSYGLAADKLIDFNSSLWSVLAEKPDSPYIRFYDPKVMHQLRSVMPKDYKLLAINQKEFKILFRTIGGYLVVFSYTSHVPEDITTYYLRGSVTDNLRDIEKTFEGSYKIQISDKMLHDQSFEVMALN